MKLQRFFVNHTMKVGEEIIIADPKLAHQLARVFRFRPGNEVMLFDGGDFEYVARIVSLKKDGAVFHIETSAPAIPLPGVELHIYPSLIKKDKLEWVIQKCTELGASGFHPVIAERSEKTGFDLERMQKIIFEATEQSGWGRLPDLSEPKSLEIAIENSINPIALDSSAGSGQGIFSLVRSAPTYALENRLPTSGLTESWKTVSLFIGPEGGWTESEKEYFSARRVPMVSLGESTLRAETASVAAAAVLLLK